MQVQDTAISTFRTKMEEHGQELHELAQAANSSAEKTVELETTIEKLESSLTSYRKMPRSGREIKVDEFEDGWFKRGQRCWI